VPSPELVTMAHVSKSPSESPISFNKLSSRPSMTLRSATAPEKMAVNGHFASQGQNGHANFEHGVQLIDEDKEFKYATRGSNLRSRLTVAAMI